MIRERLKDKEKTDSISFKIDQNKESEKNKEDNIESDYLVDEEDKLSSFSKDFIAKINKSRDLSDLQKKFLEATDQNFIFKKFSDKSNKIKNNLSNINEILSRSYSNYILDKLINNFVLKNKIILKNLDNNLYNTDYIKTKVLNISDSKLLMADIIKIYLTKRESQVFNLQALDSKLKEWLVDIIYNKNNKEIEDNKNNINKNNINKKSYDISYLGFDYNFGAKMRRFKTQKELIEKHRQLEFSELDRKYGSGFLKKNNELSKNFEDFFELEDKDLKLNFNGCRYFEDKIYRSVNIFYNQKYNKIDQQQKQVIDEYKKNLVDVNNRQRQAEIKKYIKNTVREEYKIDLILDLNKKQDCKISETDYIFKFVSNKTRDFVFDLSKNQDLFNKSNFDFINSDLESLNKKNSSDNFFKSQDIVKLKFEPKDQKLDDKNIKNTK